MGWVVGDFLYSLNVTDLTTHIAGPTFDPVRAIGDNAGYGNTGKTATLNFATGWGAQNSEAPSFSFVFPGFNPNAEDVYQITLTET